MNICFIGDSLILGINDDQFKSWPGRLLATCRENKIEFFSAYNLGVRASTSVHVKDRWVSEVAARTPVDTACRLVFSFGTADIARKIPTDDSISAATQIFTTAREYGPTMFITPPPVLDSEKQAALSGLCAILAGICRDTDIPCLDLHTKLDNNREFLAELKKTDGVHPTARGYGIMAQAIWEDAVFQEFVKAG